MAMQTSFSSSLFTSPSFNTNSNKSSSRSFPSCVQYKRPTISAAYATAERTSTETLLRGSSSSSLYDVLGVRVGADTREVKAAYRKLARVLHPDVGSGDSSADEFMKVHSAYTTLSDPEKRADYDRTLFQRRVVRSSSPLRSTSGYKTRRWETDQCW
ncbi:DnaJ domain-containing protein [Artemisia annua]|uniref:DnaJ domain-containing protein n=1 Tax=Artemisia annua TaxID=35608 RepID=A0A2U1K8J9_ARTAN|nr:DnaJ domain-containing protein [Artemisia annua]